MATPRKGIGLIGLGVLVLFGLFILVMIILIFNQPKGDVPTAPSSNRSTKPAATSMSTSSTQSTQPVSTPSPTDDIGVLIAKYGAPDKGDSTAADNPRPPIVTRFLIYEAEHVRAVYVPDAKVGDPPPYARWKLVGFQDSRDNHVLDPSEIVERLKGRKKL